MNEYDLKSRRNNHPPYYSKYYCCLESLYELALFQKVSQDEASSEISPQDELALASYGLWLSLNG